MADFGLTKAIGRAVRKGASGAKVFRPGQAEALGDVAVERQATVGLDNLQPAPVAPLPPVDRVAPTPIDPVPVVPEVQATAERLSRASLRDYALDESFQTNFDTIKTTDDVKAVIADVAQSNAGKIDQARRGTITNEQLKGLADDLDVGQDVVRKVIERESGGVLNPETILAARQVLNSSAERLKTLADKIAAGQGSDMDKILFARQVQFHNEYQTQFMGARAEAGRALNAFAIPTGADANVAARMAEVIANAGGDIERLAKAVSLTDSVPGITKTVRASIWRRSGQAAMNLVNRNFVNGILSGPPTHLVNSSGNALFQAMNIAEIGAAARIGRFLPGEEHVQVGEALASLAGTVSATKDAFRLAARTVKTGKTLDDVLKFESGTGRSTLEYLPELDKPFLGRLIKIADAVIDAPTKRLLAAEDEFFKTLAYRADLQRQALLRVQEQVGTGRITIEDAERTAREFMENAPEEAQKAAEDWARHTAFQTPLGPTGQKIQAFLRSVPVLTLIAPFVRTPTNIFKQAAYRSPVAVLTAKFWKDVSAGGRARDLALTRFAMGSATATMIATMVADGEITGAGPQQPEAKMLWEALGRRPYSKRIEDPVTGDVTWHSYARLEPIASVIGSTADAVEILSYLGDDVEMMSDEEQQAYNAAGSIVAGIMNNTGNKTFMKGIADFMEFASNPAMHLRSYANQMGAAQIPYSGALRFVRNTQDPYLREAWTLLDKIRDSIPGYSEDLPPRRGLFGELREKNSSNLLGAMSPMPESPEKHDRVVMKLQELMQETRLVPLTMPDKRIEGMRLNAREYEHLVRISRMRPIFDGDETTLHDKLGEIIDSDLYVSATPTMRVEILKSVQRQADEAGRLLLEQEDPTFAERIALYRTKKDRLRFGEQ